MDFMNRGTRPVQQNTQTPEGGFGAPKAPGTRPSTTKDSSKLVKSIWVGFAVLVAILLIGAIVLLLNSKEESSGGSESSKVDTGKFQAVFLNGGQVYFGKISNLNSKNITLDNIYYLRVNQQVQPDQQTATNTTNANDISLVKLGCELHGPQDSMVINQQQVIFWENLKDDGQVAKAVAEYVKANPNGQNCNATNNTGTTTDTTKKP